jgi:hypothetical protein
VSRAQQTGFIASLAIFALTACDAVRPQDRACQAQQASTAESKAGAFARGYFPEAFAKPSLACGYPAGPSPIIGDIEREWYPRQLRAGCEPSLYELSRRAERSEFTLRFSLIPSFHPSVFIRVQKAGDQYTLIVKEMSGAGGYDPGVIKRSKELLLSPIQVTELKRLLAEETLFEEPATICERGFDGSQWLFEIVDKGGYKMVNRWSPTEGPARNLGSYLMDVSGLHFDQD